MKNAIEAMAERFAVWAAAAAWLENGDEGRLLDDDQARGLGLELDVRGCARRAEWSDGRSASGRSAAGSTVELDCALRDEQFIGGPVVRQDRWQARRSAEPDRVLVTLAGNGPAIWLEGRRDRRNRMARADLRCAGWDGTTTWSGPDEDPLARATRAGLIRAAEIAIADSGRQKRREGAGRAETRARGVEAIRRILNAHQGEHPGERLTVRQDGATGLEASHEARWDGNDTVEILWLENGDRENLEIESPDDCRPGNEQTMAASDEAEGPMQARTDSDLQPALGKVSWAVRKAARRMRQPA